MTEAHFECPKCGKGQRVEVPTNKCIVMHTCTACGAQVVPQPGDCCIICSYSETRCPVSVRT